MRFKSNREKNFFVVNRKWTEREKNNKTIGGLMEKKSDTNTQRNSVKDN